jgi:FRG domain
MRFSTVEWWHSGTALRPKLYRKTPNPKIDPEEEVKIILDLEAEMRVEFQRRGVQFITERMPADRWEWFFLMQHYSTPTRLLNWSDTALVALYFAVAKRAREGDKNVGHDAAVYMLDPWWLNEHSFKEVHIVARGYRADGVALPDWEKAQHYLTNTISMTMSWELSVRWPSTPSHFLRRPAAQRSCFTIFGREKDGLKYAVKLSEPRLVRFDVKEDSISKIRRGLRWAGIA